MLFCEFPYTGHLCFLFCVIVIGHPNPADLALMLVLSIPVDYVRNNLGGFAHAHLQSGVAVQPRKLFLEIPYSIRYELHAMRSCPPYSCDLTARLRIRALVGWGGEETGHFDLVGGENVYG